MENKHLKQSVLTAGVIAGAAVFGGGWQEAHADTVKNSTAQIMTANPNTTVSTTDAQCAVASAQAAVSQAQQRVNSASAAVVSASAAVNSASAVQNSAASAANAAQSNYAIASAAAQSQMPSSAEQAATLNGSTIDIKNANLSMFDNSSSDASANVKNQIGEDNVTENWHFNQATQKYEMDPSLKDALTVVPTLDDESMTLDPTKLTLAQQSEINNYVAALINQIRAKFGLTAWIYNDMTLAQALAIVQHAYNDADWNINIERDHNRKLVFDTVSYQNGENTDKVRADWENIGLMSANEKQPDVISRIVKTMGDLKRATTVSIWDMLFNDAHSQNSHARMLLSSNTEYVGVAMDNYGVLHIYGLIPSALQKVNETQTALANANKDVETQKGNLSNAEKELNDAVDALDKAQDALEKANLLMAIEAVAKDTIQTSSSQDANSSTKTSTSKSQKQNSLKDVTVKATSEPTKVSQAKHGNSQLLSTSNAITTAEPSILERLLPQTGNRNGFGMTILGMLMGMLSFGFLGLRKRRY
ncbi:SEC10/PgrA surface exclusion domain-containing protein [Limosilactobacillus mucosae]